jgi:hypothetical protein
MPLYRVGMSPSRWKLTLYEPATKTASDALARTLAKSGLRATLRLPEPANPARLPYGRLPYSTMFVSLGNGKTPDEAAVVQAVEVVVKDLRARFGRAALDLNGRLFGALPEPH